GTVTPAGPPMSPVVMNVDDGTEVISVTLDTPAFLTVAGEQFTVRSQPAPDEEGWTPEIENETTAAWAHGLVINYVLGLADSEANRALLERLALGDPITLATRRGSTLTFNFASRQLVPASNRDIFAQFAPGITLILVGDADAEAERLVVSGSFISSDAKDTEVGRVVELGETAQLENLQITGQGTTFQLDRPEVPAGFAFFLVDYQIQNVGVAPFDSSLLRMVLADDLGNLYALNPAASQLGNYRPLSGPLNPGETILATAGYQIPAGLASPVLGWQVSRTDSGSQIQVNIPFREEGGAGQQAAVQVGQAQVSLDGTSLLLTGQVSNLGQQPLVIRETDVILTGNGTIYLMFSTSPGFPWIVAPGQAIPFSLTFQRPVGETAIFQVLNQPFQVSGLR
ncbi:MAG: DUF4352 domain-containing protein, partial [Chloroflexi bacterium]|nr:DUF4352 domain-containing protein [Chloroflexota bacterium]